MTIQANDLQIGRWALPERRWLGLAVLLALVCRLVFAFGYWVDQPLTVDQIEYLMLADNVQAGRGVTYDEPHRFIRSPGYPLFLAMVRAAVPGIGGVKVIQSLLGAMSVLLVATMARRLGGPPASVAAAFVMACYPPQIFQSAYILGETLFTAMALATLVLCWRPAETPAHEAADATLGPMALAGVAVGLTVLIRPEFLLFAGLLTLYLVGSKRVKRAAVLVVAMAITVAPWPLYNLVVEERVVMLSSRGGPNLWMGNNEHAVGDGEVSGNAAMEVAYQDILLSNRDLPPEQVERVFYAETLDYVRQEPLHFLANAARKAFYFWVPVGPSYQQRSRLFWTAHALSFIALMVLVARALPKFVQIEPRPIVPVALLASVFLTCLIFFPLARYRVPVFDPVLMSIAALNWHPRRR